MRKLIAILLAAIFAGVTVNAVAAEATKKNETKVEKKNTKKAKTAKKTVKTEKEAKKNEMKK